MLSRTMKTQTFLVILRFSTFTVYQVGMLYVSSFFGEKMVSYRMPTFRCMCRIIWYAGPPLYKTKSGVKGNVFYLYFQYAGSKTLPLNYTSMAESFYSQSLSSLSAWSRGLNPEVSARAAAAKDLFSSFRPSSSRASVSLFLQKLQSRLLESLFLLCRWAPRKQWKSSRFSTWFSNPFRFSGKSWLWARRSKWSCEGAKAI